MNLKDVQLAISWCLGQRLLVSKVITGTSLMLILRDKYKSS